MKRESGLGLTLALLGVLTSYPQVAAAEMPASDQAEEKAEAAAPDCETEPTEDEPETRAEQLRRERCEKAQRPPESYEAGFLERNMLAVQKAERPSILNLNYAGFYPRIQGIASGSRNAIGVRFWQPEIAPSLDIAASAFYSINKYQFYDFQIGRIPHSEVRLNAVSALPLRSTKGDDVFELATLDIPGGSGWMAYLSARYQHYPRLKYYGFGPNTTQATETNYLAEGPTIELRTGYQFNRHFLITASLGLQNLDIGPGENPDVPSIEEIFDDQTAPGLTDSPRMWRFNSYFLFDARDRAGNPTQGAMLALEYSHFSDRDGGAYTFNRYAADFRGFVPLGSPQRVLALRTYVVFDEAVGDARVPFYMSPFVGGSHTLRGFDNFRFIGEDAFLLSAEYRWEPVPPVEFALFVDTGVVTGLSGRFDFDKLQTNWGASLRLKTRFAYLFRLDWAKGPEQTRILFRFSPAW